MKLRVARKIMKAVGTPDEARYTDHQIGWAYRRHMKTRSAKEVDRAWAEMVSNAAFWRHQKDSCFWNALIDEDSPFTDEEISAF